MISHPQLQQLENYKSSWNNKHMILNYKCLKKIAVKKIQLKIACVKND